MRKAILFDLGKVLLDFEKDVILDGFRRKTDLPDEDIRRGLELYHDLGFETGLTSPREFYERVKNELSLEIPFDEFREIWCNIFTEIPPMLELFHNLRRKYRTYIVSNTDPLHFPYILEKFPWLAIFDDRAISYEIGVRKPDKAFFTKALEQFKLQPSECVYIDDIAENVLAAKDIGIDGILHKSPNETRSALKNLGIDVEG